MKEGKKVVKKGSKKVVKKKTRRKKVEKGYVSVLSTFNNTIITIADEKGDVLVQKSPANVGFTGSKKSTAYAATKAGVAAAEVATKKFGMKEVAVSIKGAGSGRTAAVKGLDSGGLRVSLLKDVTSIPHNGCRPRKRPRK